MEPGRSQTDLRSIARINGAFRPQRVTGQQRYAQEVADRLVRDYGANELAIRPDAGPFAAWLQSQTLQFGTKHSRSLLITLTSRGPIWSRRQVVVVHDLFVLTNPEWFSRKYALTHAPILRSQMSSAAAIVTVSPIVAEQVANIVGNSKDVVVAPNAPADEFVTRSRRELKTDEATAALKGRRFMLCVGSLEPRKNLRMLVDAYAGLPESTRNDLLLVLVGASSGNFSSSGLGEDREPAGLVKLGYVSDRALADLYSRAEVVLFPSLAEGFGLPIVEALASGGDLLVSDIPVFRWVGGDQVTYVDPNDPALWGDAMRDVGERAPRSHAGGPRVDIGRRFSWDSTTRTIAELVRSL